MRIFEIDGTEYTVEPCTAICTADNGDENRQDALYISSEYNGELFESVVFGYDVPEAVEAFRDMCADYAAWESDCAVICTAQRKCA